MFGGAKVVFCPRVVPFPLKFVKAFRLPTPSITLFLVLLEFRGNSVGVSYIFNCFGQIIPNNSEEIGLEGAQRYL